MTSGFVENHDGWVFDQQSGDGQPLLFASRQAVAAFADHGVVAVGELSDHVDDPGCPASLVQLCLGGVGAGVPEVGPDRVVEKMGVLSDDADLGP